jgi:nucleotide-binding universal stress UspA family protein
MVGSKFTGLSEAKEDFRRARFRAKLEQILAFVRGQSADLLPYEDVRKKLRATSEIPRGLQSIPVDAIVGSVGRYDDFTRSFLPRTDQDERRWANVKLAMTDPTGLPPIEVYQIGQAYFVLDGHHRISVARQLGAAYVEAHVIEVQTKVPLSPDVRPDDLIVKAEYAGFLGRTQLDRLRPEADLSMSVPGQYRKLEEHIDVHRYFMGIDQQRDVMYEEAVTHWYDTVYLPLVQIIRGQGILREFPDRTETDLYLWILEHRAELGKELHWEIRPEVAADDLVSRFSPRLGRTVARVGNKVLRAVLPGAIAPGPSPGTWRQGRGWRQGGVEQQGQGAQDGLFASVLVTVSGREGGWCAVEQALKVSQREEGQLIGLHVVSAEAEMDSEAVQAIRTEFVQRCEAARVSWQWIVDVGSIAPMICERSRWLDLAVVDLAHPPGDQPIARLSSGFRTLIQSCPTPILAVPRASSDMGRVLLAYDGSPKADEALFVSTYLASRWGIPLVVVTVVEQERTTPQMPKRAREYLEEHGVEAALVEERGPVGEVILRTAQAYDSELIVMGGYGFSPVLEIVLGSAVDQVLRESRQPVLICR